MPDKDPQNWVSAGWFLGLGISLFGGVLSNCLKMVEGKHFSVFEFVINVLISGFSGMIATFLCQAFEQSDAMIGAVAGISGFMGIRAWELLTLVIKVRTGLDFSFTKEDKHEP